VHAVSDEPARLQHALDLAYRHLGRRDRTVLELRRHLEARRVEPAAIEQTLATLARQGYLDDARYARAFAEDRRTLDGWGPERIARRLAQAGIEPALIDAVAAPDPLADLESALELLRSRLRAAPQDDRGRERALGLLARRGYDLDTAYDAVRAFCAGTR
jgi:regulatory protein